MSDRQNADLQDHLATWRGFTRLVMVSCITIAAVLIILAVSLL